MSKKTSKVANSSSAALPKTDICQNCGRKWREDQLEEITHGYWERVSPSELVPSGECPKCGAVCHPIENALTPYKNALKSLLDTVQATGGNLGWRKLMPKKKGKVSAPRMVHVFMEGGLIQNIELPDGVTVKVYDYDLDGVDADRIEKDGKGGDCTISVWEKQ